MTIICMAGRDWHGKTFFLACATHYGHVAHVSFWECVKHSQEFPISPPLALSAHAAQLIKLPSSDSATGVRNPRSAVAFPPMASVLSISSARG